MHKDAAEVLGLWQVQEDRVVGPSGWPRDEPRRAAGGACRRCDDAGQLLGRDRVAAGRKEQVAPVAAARR